MDAELQHIGAEMMAIIRAELVEQLGEEGEAGTYTLSNSLAHGYRQTFVSQDGKRRYERDPQGKWRLMQDPFEDLLASLREDPYPPEFRQLAAALNVDLET